MVELIAVCAVLTVLAFIAIPAYGKIKDKVREVRAMEEIRGLEKMINAYSIERGGVLPPGLSNLGPGVFLNDPWGRPYEYRPIPKPTPDDDPHRLGMFGTMTPLNEDFDLYSRGSDGETDLDATNSKSQDDIVRSGDGGYVGLASGLNFFTD